MRHGNSDYGPQYSYGPNRYNRSQQEGGRNNSGYEYNIDTQKIFFPYEIGRVPIVRYNMAGETYYMRLTILE